MITDRQLDAGLRAIHTDPSTHPDLEAAMQRVLAIPIEESPHERGWLPPFSTGRFQTMFSATKFVAAGVIVALFVGFLLTGVLPQQQSEETAPVVGASASAEAEAEPTVETTSVPETVVRTDILPGIELVTEVVEPGVLRIVSDGVRDLSIPVVAGENFFWLYHQHRQIVVAPDESVWIFDSEGSPHVRGAAGEFFRLGDQATHEGGVGRVDVDADGTVWALVDSGQQGPPVLRTFDGDGWDLKARNVDAFQLHPDGSLFMHRQTQEERDVLIGPVSKDAWKDKREVRARRGMDLGDRFHGRFEIDPSSGGTGNGAYTGSLRPGDDGKLIGWELTASGARMVGPLNDLGKIRIARYGPDGTSWRLVRFDRVAAVDGSLRTTSTTFLTRVLPGGDMSGVSFEIPEMPEGIGFGRDLAVAADQSVWLASFDGLAHFDGQTWTWYLEDHAIDDIDFAADGSVWVQAADVVPPDLGGPPIEEQGATVSTYVIRPDAGSGDE